MCILERKYTINSQRYMSWFIYPARDVNYSWISSGEAVADSVELAGGFLGALQYLPGMLGNLGCHKCWVIWVVTYLCWVIWVATL